MTIRQARSSQRGNEAEEGSGFPLEAERLIKMIDLEDPSWAKTVTVLSEMRTAGLDIDERAVSIALKLGRQRWLKDQRAIDRNKAKAGQPNSAAIVYYIRRGDLIKIGTTVNPHNRFQNLMPDEILAFEPGDQHQEMLRHHEFSHLRKGSRGEHFTSGPDLLFHIKQLRATHGEPDPTWPSLATVGVLTTLAELPAPESLELVTASDGAKRAGVKAGTVRQWIFQGVLLRVGVDPRRRPLYFLEHITRLKAKGNLSDTPDHIDPHDHLVSTRTISASTAMPSAGDSRLGVFACQGVAMREGIEVPASGLVDAELAAQIVQVKPGTIRAWKNRGHLKIATDTDGRPFVSESGRQLFEVIDVIDVEYKLRKHARRAAPSYA